MAGKPVVVVVGGGMAGLAATAVLTRKEGFVVHMLEASSRFGGRVKSVRIPDENGVSVPLGAMSFHGEKGNSLLDFAIQRGIVRREDGCDGKENWMDILSDGTRLPEHVVDSYEEVFRDILSTVSTQVGKMSMKEYVSAEFNLRTASLATPLPCSPSSLLECFLYNEGIIEGSKSMEDVDVLRYEDFECLEGIQNLLFSGNPMQQIVDTLVEELPPESLHKNCAVESIIWDQMQATHPITVHCANGEQYCADHVIITVSLGVLKKKCNSSFFSPPLPVDKQEAIASLGYGAVNKVVVQFPEPLFEEKYDGVWLYYKDRHLAEKFPWTRGLHALSKIPGTNNILICVFVGDDATMIEGLSDSQIAQGICQAFESFFHKAVPPPTVVVRSNWHGDPLFCGSYSYSALGTTKQHRRALAAPVDGNTPLQLLFAGEATHPTLFSCANAAYDTGVKEAQRLINFHTMQNLL